MAQKKIWMNKMTTLVPADTAEEMNDDLVKFCLAKMSKEKIEQEAGPEKQRCRDQVKTYTTMLIERMRETQTNVVYLQPSGNRPESWVVLKPQHSAPKKLSAASVTEELKNTTMEELKKLEGSNMTEVLKELLISKLSRQQMGKYTVAIQAKPPRIAKTMDLHQQRDDLLEVAKNFSISKENSKVARTRIKDVLSVQDGICQKASPSVERYIEKVSPALPIAPVQLEVNGEPSKFYIRSRDVKKSKNMTLKTLIPLCGEVIKTVLESHAIGNDLTTSSLAQFQTSQCLNSLFEMLQLKIDEYKEKSVETSKKITLERGLPRRM
jgi:hypothetical protein